jgi:hypothetical protein
VAIRGWHDARHPILLSIGKTPPTEEGHTCHKPKTQNFSKKHFLSPLPIRRQFPARRFRGENGKHKNILRAFSEARQLA